ncbi:MAG: cell division protein FtsB [Gammaproteobacteria bacterium]
MKIIVAIVICLLIAHFQYRLWWGDGSIKETRDYQQRLAELKRAGEEKRQRNEKLYAEVNDLHKGQEAIEERARDELGMIREEETFFQVLE